jgi:hypothetical protein
MARRKGSIVEVTRECSAVAGVALTRTAYRNRHQLRGDAGDHGRHRCLPADIGASVKLRQIAVTAGNDAGLSLPRVDGARVVGG